MPGSCGYWRVEAVTVSEPRLSSYAPIPPPQPPCSAATPTSATPSTASPSSATPSAASTSSAAIYPSTTTTTTTSSTTITTTAATTAAVAALFGLPARDTGGQSAAGPATNTGGGRLAVYNTGGGPASKRVTLMCFEMCAPSLGATVLLRGEATPHLKT